MSGSYDVFGKAETELTRGEVVSEIVQRALREESQMISLVRDVSASAQPGIDGIFYPKRGNKFVVENLVEDSEADVQTFSYESDKLDFNHHAVIAWFIKKRSEIQSMIDLEADTIGEAAAEHAIDIDRVIMKAIFAGASSSNDVTLSGGANIFTAAGIIAARAKIQKAAKVNPSRVPFFMAVNSDAEATILGISQFVNADTYAGSTTLATGEIGRLYGARVILTDEDVFKVGATTYNGVMWAQPGVVYGNQAAPELNELYIPKKVGTEYALDQLYGVKVLDSGKYISRIRFTA